MVVKKMPEIPRITVIIPTYNRVSSLEMTLLSIFQQTVKVCEIITVDDGSTDDTAEMINRLRVEYPDWAARLVYVYQSNQGKSVALNTGLEHVTGDWIAYNDSDDLWCPEKLQRQLCVLTRHPECGLCYSAVQFGSSDWCSEKGFHVAKETGVTEGGRLVNAQSLMAQLSHGVYMQTVMVRRSVMNAIGGFDPVMRVAQDVDFLFRASLHTEFCYLNQPLVRIDRHPHRACNRLTGRFPIDGITRLTLHEYMFNKWLGLLDPDSILLRTIITQRRDSTRSALANHYIRQNERRAARLTLERALSDSIQLRFVIKWLLVLLVPQQVLARWRVFGSDKRRRLKECTLTMNDEEKYLATSVFRSEQ